MPLPNERLQNALGIVEDSTQEVQVHKSQNSYRLFLLVTVGRGVVEIFVG